MFKKKPRIPEPPGFETEESKAIKARTRSFDDIMDQELVKQQNQPRNALAELPDISRESKFKPLDTPEMQQEVKVETETEPSSRFVQQEEMSRGSREIFIKIESFKEIVESLNNIGKKLEELEQVILRLQDVRTKEEQEIGNWHSNIENIKEAIKSISDNLAQT